MQKTADFLGVCCEQHHLLLAVFAFRGEALTKNTPSTAKGVHKRPGLRCRKDLKDLPRLEHGSFLFSNKT